jgi:hypothetical protein
MEKIRFSQLVNKAGVEAFAGDIVHDVQTISALPVGSTFFWAVWQGGCGTAISTKKDCIVSAMEKNNLKIYQCKKINDDPGIDLEVEEYKYSPWTYNPFYGCYQHS